MKERSHRTYTRQWRLELWPTLFWKEEQTGHGEHFKNGEMQQAQANLAELLRRSDST